MDSDYWSEPEDLVADPDEFAVSESWRSTRPAPYSFSDQLPSWRRDRDCAKPLPDAHPNGPRLHYKSKRKPQTEQPHCVASSFDEKLRHVRFPSARFPPASERDPAPVPEPDSPPPSSSVMPSVKQALKEKVLKSSSSPPTACTTTRYCGCESHGRLAAYIQDHRNNGLSPMELKYHVEQCKKRQCVDHLISGGGAVDVDSKDNTTLLGLAISHARLSMIRNLVRFGEANLNDLSYGRGILPLYAACDPDENPQLSDYDRDVISKALFVEGANPDVQIEMSGDKARTVDSFLKSAGKMSLALQYNFERARNFCDVYHLSNNKKRIMEHMPQACRLGELPFALVGQDIALRTVLSKIYTWLVMRFDPDRRRRPLSFVFAGPSGSGKTELGQALCQLLGLDRDKDFHKVQCSTLRNPQEIFGHGAGYQGSKQGSKLNDFVAAHNGTWGVVLFDEFDKSEDLHQWFHNILDGEFIDKQVRTGETNSYNNEVDCSRIIFLFTTNRLDKRFQDRDCREILDDFERKKGDLQCTMQRAQVKEKSLFLNLLPLPQALLRPELVLSTSGPFVNRITAVVPFFPIRVRQEERSILDREVEVLTDKRIAQSLHYFQKKSRNHFANVDVDLYGCSSGTIMGKGARAQLIKIVKQKYRVETGVRGVHSLVEMYLEDLVCNEWIQHESADLTMVVTADAEAGSSQIVHTSDLVGRKPNFLAQTGAEAGGA